MSHSFVLLLRSLESGDFRVGLLVSVCDLVSWGCVFSWCKRGEMMRMASLAAVLCLVGVGRADIIIEVFEGSGGALSTWTATATDGTSIANNHPNEINVLTMNDSPAPAGEIDVRDLPFRIRGLLDGSALTSINIGPTGPCCAPLVFDELNPLGGNLVPDIGEVSDLAVLNGVTTTLEIIDPPSRSGDFEDVSFIFHPAVAVPEPSPALCLGLVGLACGWIQRWRGVSS